MAKQRNIPSSRNIEETIKIDQKEIDKGLAIIEKEISKTMEPPKLYPITYEGKEYLVPSREYVARKQIKLWGEVCYLDNVVKEYKIALKDAGTLTRSLAALCHKALGDWPPELEEIRLIKLKKCGPVNGYWLGRDIPEAIQGEEITKLLFHILPSEKELENLTFQEELEEFHREMEQS